MSKVMRGIKNITKGYSSAEVKVREATSNDPWGPTGAQTAEIAFFTYASPTTCFEIMDLLYKRLNDKDKDWRHPLKALKVLECCLHEGSELAVAWARQNIYTIETLREFQYIDKYGRDVGMNVRVAAKELASLILDDERLLAERASRKASKRVPVSAMEAAKLGSYNLEQAAKRMPFYGTRPSSIANNNPFSPGNIEDERDIDDSRDCAICEKPLRKSLRKSLRSERILRPFICTHAAHGACFDESIREFANYCPICSAPLLRDNSKASNTIGVDGGSKDRGSSNKEDPFDIWRPAYGIKQGKLGDESTQQSPPELHRLEHVWNDLSTAGTSRADEVFMSEASNQSKPINSRVAPSNPPGSDVDRYRWNRPSDSPPAAGQHISEDKNESLMPREHATPAQYGIRHAYEKTTPAAATAIPQYDISTRETSWGSGWAPFSTAPTQEDPGTQPSIESKSSREDPNSALLSNVRLTSDLVRDSWLETESAPGITRHFHYQSSRATGQRHVRKEEVWARKQELGNGSFGRVWLESCIDGEGVGKVRAVKVIKKTAGSSHTNEYERELEALAKFSNKKYVHCFVQFLGWWENPGSLFISMEYIPDGDLQKFLVAPFPEPETWEIVSQILEGLAFMHENGFTHRDLKPGNVLVLQRSPAWWVKISDFGITKRALQDSTALRTVIGTPGYLAPEVVGIYHPSDTSLHKSSSPSYTSAVDIWALGEIMFRLLANRPAFPDSRILFRYITTGSSFPINLPEQMGVSEEARDFLKKTMAAAPSQRLSAKEARSHPWIKSTPTPLDGTQLKPLQHQLPIRTHDSQLLDTDAASARWTTVSNPTVHTMPQPRSQDGVHSEPTASWSTRPFVDPTLFILQPKEGAKAGLDASSPEAMLLSSPGLHQPDGPEMATKKAQAYRATDSAMDPIASLTSKQVNDTEQNCNTADPTASSFASIAISPVECNCEECNLNPTLPLPEETRNIPTQNGHISVQRYVNEPQAVLEGTSQQLYIQSRLVTRGEHCQFIAEDGAWYVQDMGSSLGTFLNGVRLSRSGLVSKRCPMQDGDVVQLGARSQADQENDSIFFWPVKMVVNLNGGTRRGEGHQMVNAVWDD